MFKIEFIAEMGLSKLPMHHYKEKSYSVYLLNTCRIEKLYLSIQY